MADTLTTIPAEEFCCASTRYPDRPYLSNDPKLAFATDTQIAIRFNAELYSGGFYDGPNKKPNVAHILMPSAHIKERFSLPEFPMCQKCGGNGFIKVPCDFCGGVGKQSEDYCCEVMFGNRHIARKYANKLALLPNVRWGVANDDSRDVMFFWFDGGNGAVMPLNPDRSESC